MQILDLDNIEYKQRFGTSGSGRQEKFWIYINNTKYLIKLNSKYNESYNEVVVSRLLDCTNISHVKYNLCKVNINNEIKDGCICKSFLDSNNNSIPLSYIVSNLNFEVGISTEEYIELIINRIHSYTNISIEKIIDYLVMVMTIDYIVMNTDRHMSNIELIMNKDRDMEFAPLFDFGRSFMCKGTMSKESFLNSEKQYKSRPFSMNPENNLIDINKAKLYCKYIKDSIGDLSNIKIPAYYKNVIQYRIDKLLSI